MTADSQNLARRDATGRWLAGISPNPSGRPKGVGEIRELARQYVPDALAKIASLIRSDDEKVALAASQEILSRVYGRPTQNLEAETVTWDMGKLWLEAVKLQPNLATTIDGEISHTITTTKPNEPAVAAVTATIATPHDGADATAKEPW